MLIGVNCILPFGRNDNYLRRIFQCIEQLDTGHFRHFNIQEKQVHLFTAQNLIRFQSRGATGHDMDEAVTDIGWAIQRYAENQGCSVVREFVGHGVGFDFHEAPQIPHYGRPGTGVRLMPGMVFTIEPMINLGRRDTKLLPDGWTVVTRDRRLAAQWEHNIAVIEDGFDVLTRLPGDPL